MNKSAIGWRTWVGYHSPFVFCHLYVTKRTWRTAEKEVHQFGSMWNNLLGSPAAQARTRARRGDNKSSRCGKTPGRLAVWYRRSRPWPALPARLQVPPGCAFKIYRRDIYQHCSGVPTTECNACGRTGFASATHFRDLSFAAYNRSRLCDIVTLGGHIYLHLVLVILRLGRIAESTSSTGLSADAREPRGDRYASIDFLI